MPGPEVLCRQLLVADLPQVVVDLIGLALIGSMRRGSRRRRRSMRRSKPPSAPMGIDAVIVDLSDVTFLDSSGISALLRGRRLADDTHPGYHVTGARGLVLTVLELLHRHPGDMTHDRFAPPESLRKLAYPPQVTGSHHSPPHAHVAP
jgi:ABC-type transporter Mla MlaB component